MNLFKIWFGSDPEAWIATIVDPRSRRFGEQADILGHDGTCMAVCFPDGAVRTFNIGGHIEPRQVLAHRRSDREAIRETSRRLGVFRHQLLNAFTSGCPSCVDSLLYGLHEIGAEPSLES